MPKLTDAQLMILSAAAQRDSGAALPLPRSLKIKGAAVTKMLEGLRKNLRLGTDGRYRWHYDPKFVGASGRIQGDERERRLTDAARRLDMPMLLVRGGSSELVSEEIAREFVASVPGARYVDVAGAAHMVAGDVNDPFTREVVGFLDGLPR